MSKKLRTLSDTRILVLGYFAVIILGAILLKLPFATRSGESTNFFDAIFTATSATCVTGLVVYDTFSHWTLFGQLVILSMIQVGGIGFMTLFAYMNFSIGQKMGYHNSRLVMESAGTMSLSGISPLVKKIVNGTMIFEIIGALFLSIRFIPRFGVLNGIYMAVFHAVSAFCNAGFDIMGRLQPNSSMAQYQDDPVVMITLMMLIIIGGIGFYAWSDIIANRFKFKKYQLHTKVVLATTGILLLSGTVLFFVFEYNYAFKDLSIGDKILASLFQSVTPRTAGFAAVDQSKLSESGSILTIIFMFIGGSPGSTAGGIKTTTVAVMVLSVIAYAQEDHDVTAFKRKIEDKMVRRSCAIIFIYFIFVLTATLIICMFEPYSVRDILFETVSAVGTVGLSMGITAQLTVLSRIILIVLMFAGRVGALSFVLALAGKQNVAHLERPTGKIMIG
ncbi:MAG: TrkH family potassium uptake protein [Clostridia bacterium]|nr:TrkH family potassium uptake protein [Clostridia bacterium]